MELVNRRKLIEVGLFFWFFIFLFLSPQILKAQEESIMKLTSPEFENNTYLGAKFTCEGVGVNPELNISGVPKATKSLVLIVDDPDAVSGIFVHWVVFDIPLTNKITERSIPGKQGVNTTGALNYVCPCPPSGTHRYFFKVYALDSLLNLGEGVSLEELLSVMKPHVLDYAELIGLYKKSSKVLQ
jgi:Raf kinase inhibitor-like YbhB/YbcL family protein